MTRLILTLLLIATNLYSMNTSMNGLGSLIMKFEGLRLNAYTGLCGQKLIGYGCTTNKDHITKEQAFSMLLKRVEGFDIKVNKKIKRKIKQCEHDALVSLTYNLGHLPNCIADAVNSSGDVPSLIKKYHHVRNKKTGKMKDVKGLIRRRNAEAYYYIHGSIMKKDTLIKKQKEGEVQKSIVKILTLKQYYVIRFNSGAMAIDNRYFRAYILPNGTSKGLPDLMVFKNGITTFIEVKRKGGKLRDSQKEFIEKIGNYGIKTVVADNWETVLNYFT